MPNSNQSDVTFKSSSLPVSQELHAILNRVLNQHPNSRGSSNITVNFRDTSYCAEIGGYHPVEIELSQNSESYYSILYITDFSYCDNVYPELERDIDFDIGNAVVFSRYSGWQNINLPTMKELYKLWESNFVSFVEMDAYDHIKVTCH